MEWVFACLKQFDSDCYALDLFFYSLHEEILACKPTVTARRFINVKQDGVQSTEDEGTFVKKRDILTLCPSKSWITFFFCGTQKEKVSRMSDSSFQWKWLSSSKKASGSYDILETYDSFVWRKKKRLISKSLFIEKPTLEEIWLPSTFIVWKRSAWTICFCL